MTDTPRRMADSTMRALRILGNGNSPLSHLNICLRHIDAVEADLRDVNRVLDLVLIMSTEDGVSEAGGDASVALAAIHQRVLDCRDIERRERAAARRKTGAG